MKLFTQRYPSFAILSQNFEPDKRIEINPERRGIQKESVNRVAVNM